MLSFMFYLLLQFCVVVGVGFGLEGRGIERGGLFFGMP
jgi:hypothetical protein